MHAGVTAVDDNSVEPRDRIAAARGHVRPADWKQIEDFLALLARAVQQLHTYPASSPLCVSALEACARSLAVFGPRDRLTCRVTPAALLVDEQETGRGTQVGQELAGRLHRAAVSAVTVDRAATTREIARFCEDLLRCGEREATSTLQERLTDHGVERIGVEMACRPEVLQAPAAGPEAAADLRRERGRFESQLARGGAVNYLYPPQKGWVRLEPHAAPAAISLLDLAVLADDPARLATWLLKLTDDDGDGDSGDALQRKYSDVTMLLSALDPHVARRMFSKLARAVLDLDPETRQVLLRRTVLPGLLDGRIDGAILRDFPDVDLAEALCLLLDLETAAPELLSTALSRLELSQERQQAMVPLLNERLRARDAAADGTRETTLVRHARELVNVQAHGGKSFADFMAFDLSLDESAAGTLDLIRTAVPATDVTATQLTCLWHLSRLEPSPEAVNGFLVRTFALLNDLERGGRGQDLPQWLSCYRGLADGVRETRPDVAVVVDAHLARFCTAQRAAWLTDLSLCEPEGREAASAVVRAIGPAVTPSLAALMEAGGAGAKEKGRTAQNRARAAAQLILEHAAALAPAIPALLEESTPHARRVLLRALGAAGTGCETVIRSYIASEDEQTAREALRALARLGTPEAARMVAGEIAKARGTLSAAAEETLWHFPLHEAQRQTRELLARRGFARSHPEATERLLDRAARAGAPDLEPVLAGLAPMRFRVWNPALARAARKANAMLKSARDSRTRS